MENVRIQDDFYLTQSKHKLFERPTYPPKLIVEASELFEFSSSIRSSKAKNVEHMAKKPCLKMTIYVFCWQVYAKINYQDLFYLYQHYKNSNSFLF